MKLSNATLKDLPRTIKVPSYDRSRLTPGIVHIGLGNFHRAHQAWYLHRLFEMGLNLIRHGINVNAIAPGVVDGEHWDGVDAFFAKYEGKAPGQKKREVGEAVPYGRMGTAADLTGMATFLASPEADYIVAQTYNVDGGNWMS